MSKKDWIVPEKEVAPEKGRWSHLHVPNMELRVVDKPDRLILARFDEGEPIIVGIGDHYSMGAFSDRGRIKGPPCFRNPYADYNRTFIQSCRKAGLEEHSSRRLWATLCCAYAITGSDKDESDRAKTMSDLKMVWNDPKWWFAERRRWAGLASEKDTSSWR